MITWEKLSPQTLLMVSRSFINPVAREAADRQWRCAVFASETRQPEAATELAEAAARAKPEYKEQIPQLFSDIGQGPQDNALRTTRSTFALCTRWIDLSQTMVINRRRRKLQDERIPALRVRF
jgi:hypothetical protein